MLIVTKIKPLTKVKYQIEINEKSAFVLYKGEVSKFRIREGEIISEEIIKQIKQEVLLKRAKLRAMHLLNDMDRTEAELYKKLQQSQYPEDIIVQAMQYVRSFGYIDDTRYAENFIRSKMNSKSRKEIFMKLCQKGISQDCIEQAFDTVYVDGDQIAIGNLIRKRRVDFTTISDKDLQKLYAYLARKGFSYEAIRQAIQICKENA